MAEMHSSKGDNTKSSILALCGTWPQHSTIAGGQSQQAWLPGAPC